MLRDAGQVQLGYHPRCPLSGVQLTPVSGHEFTRKSTTRWRSEHWRFPKGSEPVLTDVMPDDDLFSKVEGGIKHRRESDKHLLGKFVIFQALAQLEKPGREKVRYEYTIELDSRTHSKKMRRVCDVAEIFVNGDVVSYEIQLSSITPIELEERSNDYMSNGCNVVWFFGSNANSVNNRKWHEKFFGYPVQEIEFSDMHQSGEKTTVLEGNSSTGISFYS